MSILLLALAGLAFAEQPTKRPTDDERGEELWERHCTACHGPGNRGDGPATQALVVEVPDLRNKVKADDATVKLVLQGKGGMPGYETSFDRADARRVLKYMAKVHQARRTAKPPKAPEPTEEADEGDAQGDPEQE